MSNREHLCSSVNRKENVMVIRTFHKMAILLVPLTLGLLMASCGDSASDLNADATVIKQYYKSSPPPRGWKVKSVSVKDGDKIMVDILVESASDLNMIASVSRMQQFTVAKQACPSVAALRGMLTTKAGVWMQLRSKSEVLTQSVCPSH